jgi:integrase
MPRTSSTITKRPDGRYEARATFNGKRRSFFGATAEDARRKLTAALSQSDAGQTPLAERDSVRKYLETWLAAQRQRLRPSTYRGYKVAITKHLIPELGRVKLARLTATQVDRAYASIRQTGLSETSLQTVHKVLSKALSDALRRGETIRNVAKLVDSPKNDSGEMRVLTLDESRRLLDAAQGDELEGFYVLALTAGLRIGELCALRWRNVDLSRRRLTVVATLQRGFDGKYELAAPKTARSRRTVILSTLAVDALQRHRRRQLEHRLQVGQLYQDGDFCLCLHIRQPTQRAIATATLVRQPVKAC